MFVIKYLNQLSNHYKSISGPKLIKQEGHEALNRSPEYAGQRSNII